MKFFVVNNHLTDGSFNLESCWSRSVLSVITAIRLSTQRVWHTFNYDVTVFRCELMPQLGNRDVAPSGDVAPGGDVTRWYLVGVLQSRPRERQMHVTVLAPGGPPQVSHM